jgi:Ca2+-binding EF-hand superfamily protein
MKTFVTAFTVATMLTCVASTIAGPTAKGDKKPRDPAQMFKRLDANSDGQLSFDEFKGNRPEDRARKAFARMDANSDGVLKADEFKLPERKKKND